MKLSVQKMIKLLGIFWSGIFFKSLDRLEIFSAEQKLYFEVAVELHELGSGGVLALIELVTESKLRNFQKVTSQKYDFYADPMKIGDLGPGVFTFDSF